MSFIVDLNPGSARRKRLHAITLYIRVTLATLAFLIYGSAALSLHPERHSRWLVEADFSLAAAMSYSVYGTPLGMATANVFKLFRNSSKQESDDHISIQEVMAKTAAGDIPAGGVLRASTDGNGAGYPIFASFAMRLFGLHLSALTYSFLLLMGVSTLIFICRFRDDRLFTVPLQFFALTLMLLSPLAAATLAVDQAPIGGLRYFSVAAILPALHIFFEVIDRSRPAARAAISSFILLGLQVFIFAFVMFTRGSVGYLLAPILLGALFGIWSNRRSLVRLRAIIGKIGFTMVAGIAFVSIIITTVPDYKKTGRLFGTIWHRAFVSFGLHPDWPFGNLRQVYNCGLQSGPQDRNAHCAFSSSYPPAATGELTLAEIIRLQLGVDYEKTLQSAFFNVVRSYPRQVLELFVFYKSAMILWVLRYAIDFDLRAQTVTIFALTALQFMVFVVFVGWGAYRGSSEITPRAAGTMPALFVFSLLPLYVAFGYPHTSADTIFFMYANAAIVLGVLVQTTIEQVFRMPKSGMSTLLWSAARLITARSVAVSIVCATVVGVSYNYLVPDDIKAAASRAAQVASWLNRTLLLPPLPKSSFALNEWDLIEGLKVTELSEPKVAPGQHILRLFAVGADRRHSLGVRFGGLAPDRGYRVVAWVKSEPDVRVMMEARDSVDPHTGKPSNYGAARFDLAARWVVDSTGDLLASGADAVADDWVKLWVDLRSRDGKIFVLIGLLEGPNNLHLFTPEGQSVVFGGFEITESSAVVHVPLPRCAGPHSSHRPCASDRP